MQYVSIGKSHLESYDNKSACVSIVCLCAWLRQWQKEETIATELLQTLTHLKKTDSFIHKAIDKANLNPWDPSLHPPLHILQIITSLLVIFECVCRNGTLLNITS